MRRILYLLLALAVNASAQTPNQIMASATAFQGEPDRNLSIMSTYLLAGLAAASLNPNILMQNAAAFQGSSDRDLQIMQTYLLSQFPLSANRSVADLISSTRIGTTRGLNYKGNIPSNYLYLASGEGIVRSIEFTSADAGAQGLDLRTNRTLRIYVDAGSITFGGSPSTFPAGNLLAELPLYLFMNCKYWAVFRTNTPNPLAFATRYVGWVECPADSAVATTAAHYTYTLRYPIPFTNGIAIVPWDTSLNNVANAGFSFVNYELGTLPSSFRDYRLKTSHTLTNLPTGGSIALGSPVLLNYSGAGEVVSLFVSSTNDAANQDIYWESVWKQQPDGISASEAFGCAGGEDMFNNGFFFDGGANSMWDWGTRYFNKITGQSYYVEAYRHFTPSDSHRWSTNTTIWFEGVDVIKEWDSLIVFYGK